MSFYIISPEASQDLDEISDYFLSRSLEAGERFVSGFEQKCKNLVKFPNIGRSYLTLSRRYGVFLLRVTSFFIG